MARTQFPSPITKTTPPFPHKFLLSHRNFAPNFHVVTSYFHKSPPKVGSFTEKKRPCGRVEAALGGLLGGLFRGSDTGEATRQKHEDLVRLIDGLEPEMERLSDSKLIERTLTLKERAQSGESLDSLLLEAFAVV